MSSQFPSPPDTPLSWPVLVADIGGTNARFGLLADAGSEVEVLGVVATAEHGGFAAAAAHLLGDGRTPATVMVAFAGPLTEGPLKLTNCDWVIDPQTILQDLAAERIVLLNDFEALSLALPGLPGESLETVSAGAGEAAGTKLVLGPGTGLGVCGLVRAGAGWRALPSEAGHVSFGPSGQDQRELWAALESMHGAITAEHLLSGPGLVRLLRAGERVAGRSAGSLTRPAEIAAAARAGDPLAGDALARFWQLLARFARDMALTYRADGGVYLGGGVVQRNADTIDRGSFNADFVDSAAHAGLLRHTPVHIIREPFPAFRGLSDLARDLAAFDFDLAGRSRFSAAPQVQ